MRVNVTREALALVPNAAGDRAWKVTVEVNEKPVRFWCSFADGSGAPRGDRFEVDFEPDDQFAMVRAVMRYTVEAGRVIHLDGKPFVELAFVDTDLAPAEKDDRANAICTALNAYWG